MPRCRPVRRQLVLVFALSKALLLLLAFLSPGPGYDTSTTLLVGHDVAGAASASVPWTASPGDRLASKLTRWDAIYFTKIAERGYAYEQEWAFSWGFTKTMSLLAKAIHPRGDALVAHVWAGVIISNVSHLLSVLVLYRLAVLMLPDPSHRKTAFLTAALHALSPAGLFLMAPYGEALFSLLSFSGMLCFAHASVHDAALIGGESGHRPKLALYFLCMLAAGVCFALATVVRSNGLLSGLIFLHDIPELLARLALGPVSERLSSLRRLVCTILAGSVVATGLIIPQWLAYQQYCVGDAERPWCTKLLPSIYAWVQERYWNVGFLRYWTLSNTPLFLLAAPILWVMTSSAMRVILRMRDLNPPNSGKVERTRLPAVTPGLLLSFSLPQMAVAALALTNFHVQIINRISSGYPIWYLAIAAGLDENSPLQSIAVGSKQTSKSILRLIVMYAVVQGALFASFLPPA